jgi:hypothetical protein
MGRRKGVRLGGGEGGEGERSAARRRGRREEGGVDRVLLRVMVRRCISWLHHNSACREDERTERVGSADKLRSGQVK